MKKSIKNYEKYIINTTGEVINTHTNKKRKTSISNGYETLVLHDNGKSKVLSYIDYLQKRLYQTLITNYT